MGKLKGLFADVVDVEALRAAFDRVRDNDGAPGGDGQSIAQFERHLEKNLQELAADLIRGSYRAEQARAVKIPKRSGGMRQLMIPAVRDRVVQTAAANLLVPGLETVFSPLSFAYRPGRSVQQAVRMVDRFRREGLDWAVDADIHAYFDSVSHRTLIAVLQVHVDDPAFVDLVSLWLETYGPRGRGLPQGSPISPVLANLFLDNLDDAFVTGPSKLVRYADDFVILSPSRDDAERAKAKATALLAERGLDLHPVKTRIVHFDRGFRFLGRLFVRSLVIEDPWDEPDGEQVEQKKQQDRLQSRSGRTVPQRRSLYLATEGTTALVGTGGCLEVCEQGQVRLRLRPEMLERVEIYPNVTISSDVLRMLMENEIPVCFMGGSGQHVGSVLGRTGTKGHLHLAQARAVLDDGRRVALARSIVEARIHNHRALLRRLNRKRGDLSVVRACEDINRVLRRLPTATTVAGLMAHEGHSAKLYWGVLGQLLPDGWIFERRARRPPATPFDALLSYLSTILTNDLEQVVLRAGLHPGLGLLHATKDNGSACATDLVEEFRGPVAEACAVTMVKQKAVRPQDFQPSHGAGFRLNDHSRARIISYYERWTHREVKDAEADCQRPWHQMMQAQAGRLARALLRDEPYQSYRMDY
ncbi:CRISPR-associated endonuclease Cas1 [Rhizobium sp. CECT 9324]|uniref:CRISPR-associated endonuclease Cas1 n=1 Tax=Rhizobium sp. CECT 9324 TaxID=2845820 RepID=UPI001E2F68F3|nr:CRISPR-associated endonuclease Cas1 [Rhizobium sp. CECT 9324]CAH0343041.1 CRISPR-associated endonuclease Cas1 [Rhizobium sp. CECT 9324]